MLPNFRKTENEAPKPLQASPQPNPAASRQGQPVTRAGDRTAPSVIGPDLSITGNMESKGEIQIDGEIQGDITSTHVIVGEKARITGSITAEEIVIRGKVMGSIRGKRVLLQTSSHVEGDIFHQTLAIEQGAFFEGKSRRSNEPLAEGRQKSQASSTAWSSAAQPTTTAATTSPATPTPSSATSPTPTTAPPNSGKTG